jgi:multiple sugar transport system ATP-binding protein
VRPEALRIANGSDEHSFATTVDVVEPLGNEILLNFRAGGVAMVARVDPAVRVKMHDNIRLALDPQRLHFFDSSSEAAL